MEKNNDHHNNLQSSPKANALHGETADTVFATEYMFPPELFELSEPILVKEDKEKQADVTSKKVAISETKTTTSKPSVQNLDIPHDKQLSAPLQPKVAKKEKQDQEEIKEAHSVELIFADANTDPPNDDMPEDSAGGNGGDSSAPNENPGQKKEQSATPSVTDTTSNSEVPEEVMSKMENSMGADFSQVKINTNSQLAKESNALAFTQGDKIDFAPGQFNPTSLTGQRLLGHELAHVLQQREGRVTANTTSNGMPVNDDPTLENEADALGDTAARASDTMQKKNGPLNPVDSVQEKSPLSNSVVVQNKNGAAAADPTVKSAKIKIIRKGGSYIVSGTYSQIRLQLNGKSDSGQTIPTYGKIATDWISADNKKCTVYVEVILTIKLPTWSSFSEYKKKASNPKTKNRKYYQKAVAAWKKYIKNLGVHEEGHFEKDSEYFSKLSEKLKGKKESKVGGTITQYGDNAAHVHDKYHDEVGHGVPALPYIQKEVEKVPSRNSTQSGDTVVGQEKSVANNSFDSHESSASPQQLKAQATLQLQSLTTQFSSNEGEGSMRKRIVALAKGEVGKVASSLDDGSGNKKGYERLLEYFNVSAPGIWDEQIIKESRHRFPEFPHWCGIFAIWAIKKAGRDVGNWKPGRGVLDSGVLGKTDNPQPGDIGYQQRQSHHALIIEVNGNTIKSVDGNSNMGEIQIRTRSKDDYQGFFTAWGGSSVQMKKDAGKVNDAREAIMPGDVMQKMEESFGTSFNDVNIHENSSDATNAGALAYAQGTDVHFAPGQFKPDTRAGQELIGHELAHVIQQKQGRVKPTTQFNGMNINADPSLEKEADDMGRKAATQITSSSMQFSKVTTNAGHSMSRNVSQQKAVIQRGDPEDAAPVYSPETSRPRVTYSLQGSRFTLSPNTQFAEGDKMPQGVEIILRYLIGQQFAAGDNTDLLVHLYTQVPNLAFSGYQGSASGGEVMIDFMIAPVVLISIVRWLENVKGFEGVRISQEQRELIDLGYFATSAFVDLHREEVVNRLGILPPEVDQGMFLAQIARRRPLLDAYISAVLNLNENPSEENREAVIHVLMSINDVFALTHMVLDELRNSESLTDHVAYTMLFGIPEGQEQSEDEEAPEPMSPMVIRDNVSRFYQWQPTQPLMSRKIAFGEATDEEKRGYIGKYYDYIGNTLGIRTPSGDQELTDAPGRATAPPLPSNLISSPAIVAPLYSAAISTDIPFIMRVNFPDVFEAFATPVEYVWEKIRIDPESMGQDVSEMNGEETSGYGDVASSRYRRTSEYNDTDIQRVWNTFDDSIGGTAAGIGAATLVEVNNILRYVGTSAGLLFDMVMDAKNLQRMVFEDEGFYMIRCRATPQYESDEERSVMRPPSVAYMPVYARARGEMARLALDASLQRDEINADRIAEIRELLVDQCPENEEALRAELSLLETGAGSIQGIYEQELANINTRIAEIRARFGEATYLNDEYRGLRNRKGDLIMLLGHSRERREEHDFTLAERIPGTFVADLGQTIHLQLEVIDESAPGASTKSYYISDLTTKRSGQATGVGRTKAAAIENGVKEIFESISGYGRGTCGYRSTVT